MHTNNRTLTTDEVLSLAGTNLLCADFGGTATKVIRYDAGTAQVITRTTKPQSGTTTEAMTAVLTEQFVGTDLFVVTGGASRLLPDSVQNIPVIKVPEFDAIGAAGCAVSSASPQLVVSLGTGTAMVLCTELGSEHVGGTGVGGGTLMGLGNLLAETDEFDELEAMAEQGTRWTLDLSVGDIVGGDLGELKSTMAGANFGKQLGFAEVSLEDKMASLFNLVTESVASLALEKAKRCAAVQVIFLGQLIESTFIQNLLNRVASPSGIAFLYAPMGRFAVVEGAIACAVRRGS